MNAIESGEWLDWTRVRAVAWISAIAGLGMLAFLWLGRHGTVDFYGHPVGADFTAFWNAGQLANAGQASDAWDQSLLNRQVAQTHGVDYGTAWIYPPIFLLVAAPLARLDYLPALLLFQLGSVALLVAALRTISDDRRAIFIALASPFVPAVVTQGQNSLVTVALLGCGLGWMARRPATAGAMFGGLAYKPQLALILGPMLLLTRNWRAIAGAILATAALIALSLLAFGTDSWAAFQASLAFGRHYMEQGSVGFHKSASLFAMARMWGAGVPLAYAVQAIGLSAALLLLWRARSAPPLLVAAATCAGAALSTPYLLDYDLAVVGLGAFVFYVAAADGGFRPFERSALAAIWVIPWFVRPAAQFTLVQLGPVAMVLLYWLVWRRLALTASPSRR